MSLYLEWLSRVVPPRPATVRAVAATNASANVELDNDVFQFMQGGAPQSYGTALLRVQAESNDIYVLFGTSSNVAVNSAATSGNTVCSYIAAGQDREFEINPNVDKYMAYATKNGATSTATIRYWIVSFPKSGTVFGA
ncbi:MAG TPA: hypothetical protein VMI75_21620 [Polyangiaceae bacterium]|nr:hypothetical protein [Polyangiaceae bacterium]